MTYMKRFAMILAVILTFVFSSFSAYAADEGKIAGVYALKGRLYYYDTPTDRIVLTGVSPVASDDGAKAAAKSAEYTELRVVTDGMFFKDKNKLAPEWVNNYVDREVWFIVAVAKNGEISVPYLILNV